MKELLLDDDDDDYDFEGAFYQIEHFTRKDNLTGSKAQDWRYIQKMEFFVKRVDSF